MPILTVCLLLYGELLLLCYFLKADPPQVHFSPTVSGQLCSSTVCVTACEVFAQRALQSVADQNLAGLSLVGIYVAEGKLDSSSSLHPVIDSCRQ